MAETGIEGNLPKWAGASAVYRKAYKYMDEQGPDFDLIDALNKGDEELIKGLLLLRVTLGYREKDRKRTSTKIFKNKQRINY